MRTNLTDQPSSGRTPKLIDEPMTQDNPQQVQDESPAPPKEENGLVDVFINKVVRDSGDILTDPQGLLEHALLVAELEHPNQSLALQICCGPLETFGDRIPPWFGSQKRRRAHYARSLGKTEVHPFN